MKLLLGTFLFSVASALLPILNVEAYLAAVAVESKSLHTWELAIIGGVGQAVGKIIWYYAGVNSMKIPWLRKKLETEKWRASYDKWHERTAGKPLFAGTIVFASAVTGFPPLAVVAVLAGALRINFPVFLATVVVGRSLRFLFVLELAGWLKHVVGLG